MSASERFYRLHGSIENAERTFQLGAGVNRIGSSETNEIVLSVRGVSRRHARLTESIDGLLLEDLGSKNGTYVNGERVQQSRVDPGAVIRLGPVELKVEEIEASDADLALHFEAQSRPSPQYRDETTDILAAPGKSSFEVRLLEELVTLFAASSSNGSFLALGRLARELRASGACLLEWVKSRDPVTLAVYGDVEDPSSHERLLALKHRVERESASCETVSTETPVPTSYGVLFRPNAPLLGLVLFGRSCPAPDAEAAARVFLALADLVRYGTPASSSVLRRPGVAALEFPEDYVPGIAPSMIRFYEALRALLRSSMPVLVEGETGAGKEHVARILHASSTGAGDRRRGPFIAVNCAAIPHDLLEAEMFGVGQGAATAVRARAGQFQLAHGGTLLLDEIAEMPLELQPKLLRALETREIQPVGSASLRVDVRVVSSTNADLARRVQEGRFRSDLYYRVAGAVLRVPPLRERVEDIPPLVAHFLSLYAREAEKNVRGVTVKALKVLEGYPWPGNVRELQHEMSNVVQGCPDGAAVDSAMLPAAILQTKPVRRGGAPRGDALSLRLKDHLQEEERRIISLALERAGGSQRKAARILCISRNALARRIARLGISKV